VTMLLAWQAALAQKFCYDNLGKCTGGVHCDNEGAVCDVGDNDDCTCMVKYSACGCYIIVA
jgi:hypothetical protein